MMYCRSELNLVLHVAMRTFLRPRSCLWVHGSCSGCVRFCVVFLRVWSCVYFLLIIFLLIILFCVLFCLSSFGVVCVAFQYESSLWFVVVVVRDCVVLELLVLRLMHCWSCILRACRLVLPVLFGRRVGAWCVWCLVGVDRVFIPVESVVVASSLFLCCLFRWPFICWVLWSIGSSVLTIIALWSLFMWICPIVSVSFVYTLICCTHIFSAHSALIACFAHLRACHIHAWLKYL